jgi:glycosyltransferase involved in cell wall biosynthesis
VISIVLPVYNEETRIEATLDSLVQQSGVGQVELLVVDSGSTDRTILLTAEYGVKLLQAPRGKITARRVGIDQAQGDIIVAVDGDSIYPPGWLAQLTGHFADERVVGVSGPRIYSDAAWLNLFTYPWGLFFKPAGLMCGGNSAFRRADFFETGGFYATDELDVDAMIEEEELSFGYRLMCRGTVVKDQFAYCYTTARRWFEARHAQERQRGERF